MPVTAIALMWNAAALVNLITIFTNLPVVLGNEEFFFTKRALIVHSEIHLFCGVKKKKQKEYRF